MGTPLQVLIVEDVEDDALLVVRELERGDYDITFQRVDTRETMTSALEEHEWDVVIADYSMPYFNAPDALALLKKHARDVPFIVVSGSIGEDVAVGMMKAGAHDYLLKGNLKRLVPAVDRELREVAKRRKGQKAEEEAMRERNRAQTYLDIADVILVAVGADEIVSMINRRGSEILGCDVGEIVGKNWFDIFLPDEKRDEVRAIFRGLMAGETAPLKHIGYPVLTADGVQRMISWHNTLLRDEGGKVSGALSSGLDITEQNQAKEALEASEVRYRQIVENANEAIIVVQDGIFKFFNPKVTELIGFSEEELAAKPFSELIHPDDRDMVVERHVRRLQGETPPNVYDFRVVDERGHIRWVQINAVSINWEGKPATLNFIVDVTQRKRAEAALRDSEEFSSSLLANCPTPMLVINPDTSLKYANPALEALTGFTSERLIGTVAPYPWWIDQMLPKYFADLREAMTSGVEKLEQVYCKRDGERFWVEVTCMPVRANGELKYCLAAWVDVTERMMAEAQIRQSEAKFRNIINRSADAIVVVSKDAKVQFANPAAELLFGRRANELMGQHFGLPMVAGGKSEIDIVRRQGGQSTAEMRVVQMEWEGQNAYLALLRDITQRKELDRMKTEFILNVSHELRTPLTIIRETVAQLLDGLLGETTEEQQAMFRPCMADIDRLARIINSLLDISRIEARKLALRREKVDIVQIARDVASSFSPGAKEKGLELRVNQPDQVIDV